MKHLESLAEEIGHKVNRLGEEKRKMAESLAVAAEENARLQVRLAELEASVERMTEEYNMLKMAKSLSDTADAGDARKRINELVKEIDKCIALLNP